MTPKTPLQRLANSMQEAFKLASHAGDVDEHDPRIAADAALLRAADAVVQAVLAGQTCGAICINPDCSCPRCVTAFGFRIAAADWEKANAAD